MAVTRPLMAECVLVYTQVTHAAAVHAPIHAAYQQQFTLLLT